MSPIRAILIALVAVSVALLPIATIAGSATASIVVTQSDCCNHAQPCKGKNVGGCEQLAGCTLKCGSVSAAIIGNAMRSSPLPDTGKLPLLTRNIPSASDNPPLPPPRV